VVEAKMASHGVHLLGRSETSARLLAIPRETKQTASHDPAESGFSGSTFNSAALKLETRFLFWFCSGGSNCFVADVVPAEFVNELSAHVLA
jgi:hypothetical protein